MLFAGDKAVELERNQQLYRDARAIARALSGDISGAIKDFQIVIEKIDTDSDMGKKRQTWLEALESGTNPFTPEVIKELRSEVVVDG